MEKKTNIFCIFIVGSVMLISSTVACRTTGPVPGAGESVLDHQEQITRLEDRVRIYETTVAGAISQLEELGRHASSTETTVDDVIRLFDDYQRTVERIIQDYRKLQSEIEYISTSRNGADNSNDYPDTR